MDATNVISYGTFISHINNYQDEYELKGVRYAVYEEYHPEYGTRYWADPIK